MKYDQFAFFNQQLASMLREGIPLEGALRQLSADLSGPLKTELAELNRDLSTGISLTAALERRRFPEFYKKMVALGVRSNDLPGILTVVADYYHRANTLWSRLKGLLVYPFIVLTVSMALSIILVFIFQALKQTMAVESIPLPTYFTAAVLAAPVTFALVLLLGVVLVSVPRWRAGLRWRLPAFREASLAELATVMALMLKNGMPLPDALAFAESIESNSPAGAALAKWRAHVERGEGKPSQWVRSPRPFPPMFLWLVEKGGDDLAAGFDKAAELYRNRANYRIELALYGALPISVLLLGQLVLWQIAPVFHSLSWFLNSLGGGFE